MTVPYNDHIVISVFDQKMIKRTCSQILLILSEPVTTSLAEKYYSLINQVIIDDRENPNSFREIKYCK